MGSADSEVGEGTAEVVVESAIFDPVAIRRTMINLPAGVSRALA